MRSVARAIALALLTWCTAAAAQTPVFVGQVYVHGTTGAMGKATDSIGGYPGMTVPNQTTLRLILYRVEPWGTAVGSIAIQEAFGPSVFGNAPTVDWTKITRTQCEWKVRVAYKTTMDWAYLILKPRLLADGSTQTFDAWITLMSYSGTPYPDWTRRQYAIGPGAVAVWPR